MPKRPSYVKLKLDKIRNSGWAVGRSFPRISHRRSDALQLGYNVVSRAWSDKRHYHAGSEEWYIVLKGKLDVEVDGRVIAVGPKEILGVKSGVPHRVVGGRGPIEEFSIRTPSIDDKKLVELPRRNPRRM